MLEPVQPHNLRDVWEFVRAGLVKTIAKTKDDWLPEDVYMELKSGVSHLYMIYENDENDAELIGFVIFQRWDKYHAGPRLFVRALWAKPGKLRPVHDAFYAEMDDLSLKAGARVQRMASPRRWYADGWTLKQYIYERTI